MSPFMHTAACMDKNAEKLFKSNWDLCDLGASFVIDPDRKLLPNN